MTAPSKTIEFRVAYAAAEGENVRVTLNEVTDPNAVNILGAATFSFVLTSAAARSWFIGDVYTVDFTPKPAVPANTTLAAAAPVAEPVVRNAAEDVAAGPVNASVRDAAKAG